VRTPDRAATSPPGSDELRLPLDGLTIDAPRASVTAATGASAPELSVREAFRQVFPGVMVAMFLAAADQTILASALPTIASHLAGFEYLSWVVVAYLLAATIAAPLYGHLGDRFGRKRMLLVALSIFTIASAGCAAAPTLLTLVIARAVQGLGGGGLMTLAQALIGEHVPPRDRGRFQGYFAAVFALASTSGPILGAYLTEHVSWRSVFAINLPLGVLAAYLARRIPNVVAPHRGAYEPDVIGTLLFCAATLGMLFTLSAAGHALPFDSWTLYAVIIAVVAGYAALFLWEQRTTHPVIPVRLLRQPEILRPDAVVVCFAAALFATVLYLPLYLQIGRGLGIGTSGMLLLPITLAMVTGATVTGRLVSRTGKVTIFPIVGLTLATAALVALGTTITFAPTALVLVLTAMTGIGLGMVMPAMQVAVQFAAGRESLGAAIGSMSLCRSMGGAIGVAAVGAIVFVSIGRIHGGAGTLLATVMQQGPEYLDQLSAANRNAIVALLDRTFRIVFFGIATITAIGALVATTVPKPRL
jgi:EmrB/QacA subfamily drug resistance transporter